MQVICDGNYIESDGPATFKHDDEVRLEVDCIDINTVFIHLTGQ
ncbi:hypothetical protein [Mycobacterium intracellulare]|nr:hypothetical protein [Mycobacterium intracellulare]